jgi:hypothetical protein
MALVDKKTDRIVMDSVQANRAILEKAKARLDAAEAALTRFEEDARRAGVPPGWLR